MQSNELDDHEVAVDTDDVQAALVAAMRFFNDDDLENATEVCKQLIEKSPEQTEAFFILSIIAFKLGDIGRAIQMAKHAHDISPDTREYVQVLAAASVRVGKLADGVYYAKLAQIAEPHPLLSSVMPAMLADFGDALQKAAPSQHVLQGMSAFNVNDISKAILEFSAELRINPDNALALMGLGRAALIDGQQAMAIGALQKLMSAEPSNSMAMAFIARALTQVGRYGEARALAMQAIELCDGDAEVYLQAMTALQTLPEIEPAALQRIAERFNEVFKAENEIEDVSEYKVDADKPVHIGFISNGFYRTALSEITMHWFDSAPPGAFVISGFQQSTVVDSATSRFMLGCDNWRKVFDTDPWTMAISVEGDELDILVDISNPDSDSKISLMGLASCPVRVGTTALAEPGLMPGITHILSDEILADVDREMLLDGQELIVVPGTLFARDSYAATPELSTTPAKERGHITLGTIARLPNHSPEFALHLAEILNEIPGARLAIYGADKSSDAARLAVREYFLNAGVADRVEFVDREFDVTADSNEDGNYEDLIVSSRYWNEIDIYVDTSPICAGPELCEALWHGVPSVSLRGRRRASAVGASILNAAGRSDWVASDRDNLSSIIVDLAGDIDALTDARASLIQNIAGSALFAGRETGRHIRKALYDLGTKNRATK